jgi:CRISPR-associated protein Cas5t
MDLQRLYVSVPVAGFRVAQAREYWETYPCPPPSTVYGMLLSLVGEENRLVHCGAEVAIGLLSDPSRSAVLRTLWRVKDAKVGPGLANNKRPDYQELLSNIRLSVWVRQGTNEKASTSLAERLAVAFDTPANVHRFGGLSLGESTHLVDDIRHWRQGDPAKGLMLLADDQGDLSLPIWPDHVGSQGTRWGQFKLTDMVLGDQPPDHAWTTICPPETDR